MVFRDFLRVARDLADKPDEASWRSAISRAYYAVFHVARDLLADLGFRTPRADSAHAFLWLRLSNTSQTEVNDAGRNLNDLRSERNRADYKEKPAVSQSLAKDALRTAEKAIAEFDRIRQAPQKSQIIDAIKIYERDVLKEPTWRP